VEGYIFSFTPLIPFAPYHFYRTPLIS